MLRRPGWRTTRQEPRRERLRGRTLVTRAPKYRNGSASSVGSVVTTLVNPVALNLPDATVPAEQHVELPPVRPAIEPVDQRRASGRGPEREVVDTVARRLRVAEQGHDFIAGLAHQSDGVEHAGSSVDCPVSRAPRVRTMSWVGCPTEWSCLPHQPHISS